MHCFGEQEPWSAGNAGRDALPLMVTVTAYFALRQVQTESRASAGVSAHSRDAKSCLIGERSFECDQPASGAFASTHPWWAVLPSLDYLPRHLSDYYPVHACSNYEGRFPDRYHARAACPDRLEHWELRLARVLYGFCPALQMCRSLRRY